MKRPRDRGGSQDGMGEPSVRWKTTCVWCGSGREVTLSRHVSSGKIRMIAQRVSVDQPSLWAVV